MIFKNILAYCWMGEVIWETSDSSLSKELHETGHSILWTMYLQLKKLVGVFSILNHSTEDEDACAIHNKSVGCTAWWDVAFDRWNEPLICCWKYCICWKCYPKRRAFTARIPIVKSLEKIFCSPEFSIVSLTVLQTIW